MITLNRRELGIAAIHYINMTKIGTNIYVTEPHDHLTDSIGYQRLDHHQLQLTGCGC